MYMQMVSFVFITQLTHAARTPLSRQQDNVVYSFYSLYYVDFLMHKIEHHHCSVYYQLSVLLVLLCSWSA